MDQDKIIKKAWEIAGRMKRKYVSSEMMSMAQEELTQEELLSAISGEENLRKESNKSKVFTGRMTSYQEFNQDIADQESQLQDELSRTL